ncbi:hypothetical protein C0J52_21684 [Blattella germanica]|nr:hypothetical protein C0J52_21684 [Blattella germanica]
MKGCPNCHEADIVWGSPRGVMDRGFPSNPPESRLRRFVLLLILVMADSRLFTYEHSFIFMFAKVTIIIRGSILSPCSGEKTYEATSDAPLPVMFIDGTQRSGAGDGVLLTVFDPQRVEIYIRYIETTLIVRKAGTYLAFSARMPEELVKFNSGASGDYSESRLQLCVRGCPKSERLDPVSERGHKLPWDKAVERCRRSDSNDVITNLTDPYLDWCVFDVMTTGDGDIANEFTAAAHSAQADVLRLDPASVKNRTGHLDSSSNHSSTNMVTAPSVLVFIVLLAVLLRTS